MEYVNLFGLAFIAAILAPNVLCAILRKDAFENRYHNKAVLIAEQIGRYGCMAFMVIYVPGTFFGWWSDEAFALYLLVDTVLVVTYCVLWGVLWKKQSVFKALALSIVPAVIFLFSGIMSRSVLLLASALIFAPAHIFISCKNAKISADEKRSS